MAMTNLILSTFDFLASNLFQTIFICFGIAILWVVIAGLFYWKDGEFGGGKGSIKIDYKEDE